jgi:hypothetical protein
MLKLEQIVDIIWIIVNISINILQTIAYFNFVLYLLSIQVNWETNLDVCKITEIIFKYWVYL